jgi:hypothetical protein
MSKIYGNAHVTFRADASSSCRQGFLTQRGRRILVPFQSRSKSTLKGIFSLQFKHAYHAKADNLPVDSLYDDSTLSTLSNRGWTFQENLSSTRILLFGHTNVHFICQYIHHTRGRDAVDELWQFHSSEKTLPFGEEVLYRRWAGILFTYTKFTRSSFTKPTDLLPALSGLASIFHQRLQDDSFSGHWRRDMFRSLLWDCTPRSSKSDLLHELQSSSPYLCPSWSGLCRGHVEGREAPTSQLEAEEMDAQVELAGENPFGAIRSGQLIIRSNILDLASFNTTKLTLENPYLPAGRIQSYRALSINGQSVGMFALDFRRETDPTLEDMESYKWVLLSSDEAGEEAAEVATQAGKDLDRGAWGLIVCPTPEAGKYYRIGIFRPLLRKVEHKWGSNWDELANYRLFQRLSKTQTIVII